MEEEVEIYIPDHGIPLEAASDANTSPKYRSDAQGDHYQCPTSICLQCPQRADVRDDANHNARNQHDKAQVRIHADDLDEIADKRQELQAPYQRQASRKNNNEGPSSVDALETLDVARRF